MSITLQALIPRAREAKTAQTLWSVALEFFLDRGAQMVSYRHFAGDTVTEEKPMLVTHGFPDSLVERFLSEKLYNDNPIAGTALKTPDPFYWSDVEQVGDLSEDDLSHLEQLRTMMPGDGLIIQVFGPCGRNGTVNLCYPPDAPRLSGRDLRELQLAAQLAHLRYCKLVPLVTAGETPLTDREREVLEWISKGKSNSVIADILGISIHTVDTHVRRIFRKLDVNDRTTAAVKGLGSGLVQSAA